MNALLLPQDQAVPILVGFLVMAAIYGVPGIVCAVLAPGRGRSAIGWFFIGVVLNCLGIVLILLLPNLKLEEDKARRQKEETRRLREQLKKERQIADERHVTNRTRLDVHDKAIGIDTSADERRLIEAGMAPPPLPAPGDLPVQDEPGWFYAVDGEQRGPVPLTRLRAMLRDGAVDGATLVWREGMQDWAPIADTSEILRGKAS